jgi:hypothetical protein
MSERQHMDSDAGIVVSLSRKFEGVLLVRIVGLAKYARFGHTSKERRP